MNRTWQETMYGTVCDYALGADWQGIATSLEGNRIRVTRSEPVPMGQVFDLPSNNEIAGDPGRAWAALYEWIDRVPATFGGLSLSLDERLTR